MPTLLPGRPDDEASRRRISRRRAVEHLDEALDRVETGIEVIGVGRDHTGAAETGLGVDAKAQAGQVRSVAVERMGDRVGLMTPPLLAALDLRT